jgi:GH25 family lysozyme M1 (1,4-beta-N-acetylmuramidase)
MTTKGVDVSTQITSSAASCLESSGYSFVIPRAYESVGQVDSNSCTSIKNAYNAGIKVRDAYFFPDPTSSKSASTQMSEFVSYVSANCKTQWSGRLWLDVEGTQYWLGSTSKNQAFYKSLVDACKSQVGKCGIYCSQSQWSALFGSSYVYGNDLPVWYAHYDGVASFSDWSTHTFGGWKTPYAKQYDGTTTVCGMGVDLNYSPNFAA